MAKLVAHFGLARPHAVGPDVGTSALLFAAANHAGLFSSITIGGGASIFPLQVIGPLKDFIDAPSIDNFRGADVGAIIRSVVGAIPNYDAPTSVVQDYIDSYAGDRFPESVAFVRAYPKDLATLSSKLGSIDTPVQILSSGHDPYVLQSEPAELKSRLPKGRLVVLKSGHYAWEEDPVTFAGHISSWIDGGYLAP